MVEVTCAGGSRRLVGGSGGRKCSVLGNEFGVFGGEHLLLVTSVSISVLLLVTAEARLSMLLSIIPMKVANWGGIVLSLAPESLPVEWWRAES